MARVANVDIPDDKQIAVSLTYIYGIGRSLSQQILAAAGVNPTLKTKDLTESDLAAIRDEIDKNHAVEGDLAQRTRLDINRLKEINSYRGERHKKNLPVRGQQTRTNARTKRGRRVTVGSGRVAPPPKT